MNQHLYRIVFNQHRGQLMVVAEHASSNGKDGDKQDDTQSQSCSSLPLVATLRPLTLALLASMGMLCALPAAAQVVADRNAPAGQRPTVLVTANGLPQVNIQTPSAAGVSRNTYTQFDVAKAGLVLNNGRTDSATKLGGWVQANPWLATGSARVILNEINSSNPSQLNGYVEVAGQRAEVIIANPAGINVDGGGFINASRATLTTGTAIVNNGALAGFLVQGGTVTINGQGFDASSTDYTGILARAAQINAGIWANELKVVTGANQIDAGQSTISTIAPLGAAPAFALDIAQLGGMYANKIFLIGTEAGVGVRTAGSIGAAAGQVIVTSAGRLENSGSIAATSTSSATLQVTALGGIDNTGSLTSSADMTLAAGADLSNGGTVFAAANLLLTSAANIGNSGTLHGATSLSLTAATLRNSGLIHSEAQTVLALQGDADNTAGTISSQRIAFSSALGAINNQNGKIVQSGAMGFDVSASGLNNGHGGQVGVAPVAATPASSSDSAATTTGTTSTSSTTSNTSASTGAGTMSNTGATSSSTGAISSTGTISTSTTPVVLPNGWLRAATVLNNDGGLISAGGTLTLAVANLDNTGGKLNLDSLVVNGANFSNQDGKVSVANDFSVHAATFGNVRGSVLVGAQFDGQLGQFDNTNGLLQASLLRMNIDAALDNSGGVLRQSGTNATLISVGAAFNNQGGRLETAGSLSLTVASMTGGGGTLVTLGDLRIDAGAGAINAHGSAWVANGNVTVHGAAFDNSGGSISAGRDLTINSASLNNRAGALSALANNVIAANGALDNAKGTIQAGATLQVSVAGALGNQGGVIETLSAGSHLLLQAADIDNTAGRMVDVGSAGTRISSDGSVLNSGVIAGNGDLTLLAASLTNLTGGKVVAGKQLELGISQALANSGGAISSGASLNFNQGAARFANSGQIIAGTSGNIYAASIDNDGGVIATSKASGGDLSLTAGAVSNQGGAMAANHSLVLTASGAFDNTNGMLHAEQDVQLGVLGMLGVLNNNAGVIEAVGASSAMRVATGSTNNGNGHIQNLGSGATSVASQGGLLSSGVIAGNGAVSLTAATLNNSGAINAGQALDLLVSQTLDNMLGGAISSGDSLNFKQAGADFSNSGQIVAAGAMTLSARQFVNHGNISTVKHSAADILLSAAGVSNDDGVIVADRHLAVTSNADLDNTHGTLQAGQNLLLASKGKLGNDHGVIEALAPSSTLSVQADAIDSTAGRFVNLGNAETRITSQNSLINSGLIAANGHLTLAAQTLANQTGGAIRALGQLDLAVQQQLDNQAAISSGAALQFSQAGAVFNNSGQIVAGGDLALVVGALNNSLGLLQAGQDLRVAAGASFINRAGTIEAIGACSSLALQAQSIDNSIGRITNLGSADMLLASATALFNGGAIAGNGNVTLEAQSLQNNSGASIGAGGNLILGVTQQLTNQGAINSAGTLNVNQAAANVTNSGNIIAGGAISIVANHVNNDGGQLGTALGSSADLSIQSQGMSNAGGHIVSDRDLTIATHAMASLGELSAGRDLALSMDGDYTQTASAQLHAKRDLSLSITGNFTNAATLAAVRTLDVSASAITNQFGATLQGDGVALHAVGAVSNAGTINGAQALAITAASVDNSNSIVGGKLSITAQDISNSGAQALIGATDTLSLWLTHHLSNSNGATIYSAGDMAIAADQTRDANGLLSHRTALIDNTSASMEAAGNLEMVANTVNNTRSSVTIEQVTTLDETTVMTMPPWWTNGDNHKYYDLRSSNSIAKEIYYINPADILSTSVIYTPDGLELTRAVIKTHANDTVFFNAWTGWYGNYGHRDRIVQTDGTQIVYYRDRSDGQNNPDQVAGITSGVWVGEGPNRQWDGAEPFSNQYGSCTSNCVRLVLPYQYNSPLTTIDRETQHANGPYAALLEIERDAHHVAVESRVTADSGVAAQIRSGGNLRLSVDQGLNNQYSNIVANGALFIDGSANAPIINEAMTLYRTHSFDGAWFDSNGTRTAYTMPSISEAIGSLTGLISGGQGVFITGRSFANIDLTAGSVGNLRTALDVLGSGVNGGTLTGIGPSGTQNTATTSSAGDASGMHNNAVGGQPNSTGASVSKTAPAIKSAILAARGAASVIKVAPTGLATQNPNPAGQTLFETRSEFTNHGNWISSDYLLTALNFNADTAQKRLGDGFYEQRLVREQLSELTGRAPAGGISDDATYKNLLDSGISYARQWDLRPGIALTATQIAHLTSDIVWLESETVTLPDGSTHTVLAPKVYLAHLTAGSVTAAGALVTGNNVTINVGDITNRGGVIDGGAGRTLLIATQDILNSSGAIKGATVALQAGRDIVNQTLSVKQTYATAQNNGKDSGNDSGNYVVLANQGAIAATGALTISAGRDVNNIGASLNAGGAAQIMAGRDISLTSVQTGSEHTSLVQSYSASDSSILHQTSALNVGGDLTMVAGEDVKLSGAQLAIKGNGVLAAGRDMVVSAVIDDVKSDHHNDASAKQYDKQINDNESVVGASVKAGGNLALKAGGAQSGSLSLLGSAVAATGDMSLAASGDVTIATVTEHHLLDVAAHDSSSGFLSKRTSSSIDYSASSVAVGSSVEGKSIVISSGNDIAIKGSTIVADKNIDISAVRDLSVVSAQNTQTSNNASSSTNSGLMSGSMGFAIGKVSSKNSDAESSVTQASSQIASLGGNVKMRAGGVYTQTASQIDALAPATGSTGNSTAAGDVSIVASKINMSGANDSSTSQNHADYSKTALGVTVDIPIVDAVKSISALAQAAGKTSDSRMQALAAATLVAKTMDLAKAAATPTTTGVKVSLSLSNSKTASDALQASSTVVGSTVSAAGNVSIIATGAGAASTLDIIGSTVSAGNNATVLADGKINLAAATNTSTQTSTNSGSGWSAGVGYTFGPSAGTTFDFGANKANGTVSGQDTSAVNTYIKAGNTATLSSGGDTSMIGAVISGNTVDVSVAGKLNIASVQDTSTYASSNHSASVGASLCIPPFCVGKSSVSGSLSQSNATSDYASVIEQSGIKAGDGGFHVNVAGNTDLKGAVIASSDKAVSDGANSLHTGTLTSSDMENHARTDVKNTGISLSSDMFSEGKYGLTKGVVSNLLNNASESGSSSGQSRSAVSAGLVTIADDKGQQQLTGKTAQATIDSLNRNTADAQTAAQKQDVQGMKQSVDAVQLIKNEAVQQVSLVTDAVYNAATAEKKILLQTCDANGINCKNTQVGLKDHDIAPSSDGMIHVFNNGIMNTEAQALDNAAKQSQGDANSQGVYVVINPYTGSTAGEVLYAGWDKFMAPIFGISNASEANIDLVNIAKKTGAMIDFTDHSRGGITLINATGQMVANGETQAPIAKVQLNGSAGNAESIQHNVDLISSYLGQVYQSTQTDDLVGKYIGGNPATGGLPSSFGDAHGSYGPNADDDKKNKVWGMDKQSFSMPALRGKP